jgi:hypothetical protein
MAVRFAMFEITMAKQQDVVPTLMFSADTFKYLPHVKP